jgi:hypothetical protein
MSIVMYLGSDIKEYEEESEKIINEVLSDEKIRCEFCLRQMRRHSSYRREIKESGREIQITVVWCRKCKNWHSLQPDFLLPNKHYSGNEIESVIIDSATLSADKIETDASYSTVMRWIKQIGGRIRQATNKLKYHFGRTGHAVSEAEIDAGDCYSELEQVLEKAPRAVKYSGNRLGLANIWLGASAVAMYI